MAADRIEIIRDGADVSVLVDGVEIPARAIRDGDAVCPVVPVTLEDAPSVTLTLSAKHLTMDNKVHMKEVRGD